MAALRKAAAALERLTGKGGLNQMYLQMVRNNAGRQRGTRQIYMQSPRGSAVPWHHRLSSESNSSRLPVQRLSRPGPFQSGHARSPFSNSTKRNFHSSRPRKAAHEEAAEAAKDAAQKLKDESLSFSGRMRKLSREYGWATLGVYLGLTILDFPFCFLLVRMLGTDRIAAAEHIVVSNVAAVIPESAKQFWREYRDALKKAEINHMGDNEISEDIEMAGWGVKEADERNNKEASLGTQLALAYAIHKSFIFIRVPLTAAITPRVVKVLRGWGWQIGKRKAKV